MTMRDNILKRQGEQAATGRSPSGAGKEGDMSNDESTRHEVQEWKYAAKAMSWYGWGSPVGLGLFLVGLGGFVVLLRFAITGT
jgi:hypothetical protein